MLWPVAGEILLQQQWMKAFKQRNWQTFRVYTDTGVIGRKKFDLCAWWNTGLLHYGGWRKAYFQR